MLDPMETYARLEALVDPTPARDAATMATLATWAKGALGPGRGAELERTATFPAREIEAFARAGLSRELVPHDQGGAFEWSRLGRLCGRLSAHDLDVALCLGGAVLGALPVLIAGSADHRARYFAPLLQGGVGGLGLSEWSHGSDLLAGETTATPIDDEGRAVGVDRATRFRLRGTKSPINNGALGACLVVLARTGEAGSPSAQSLFVVPRSTPGLSAYPRYASIGFRDMDLSGAVFDDAIVPRSALLGAPGDGFLHTRRALEVSRSGVAAMALGPMATALALSLDHARGRVLYGAPIDRLGGVRALLARSFARAVAAIALGRRAARAVAHAAVAARAWTCAAKLVCPRLLEESIADGGTLLGARSLMEDLPFARLRRSAPVLAIFDGSSQLQLDELWRYVATWRPHDGLSHARALEIAHALADPPTTFDPHRDDDGAIAEASPSALLWTHARDGSFDGAFARAAQQLGEQAGRLRGRPQDARFSVSSAAGSIYALAALAEARAIADETRAKTIDAAFDLFAVESAPALAATLTELGCHEEAASLLGVCASASAARARAFDALDMYLR